VVHQFFTKTIQKQSAKLLNGGTHNISEKRVAEATALFASPKYGVCAAPNIEWSEKMYPFLIRQHFVLKGILCNIFSYMPVFQTCKICVVYVLPRTPPFCDHSSVVRAIKITTSMRDIIKYIVIG